MLVGSVRVAALAQGGERARGAVAAPARPRRRRPPPSSARPGRPGRARTRSSRRSFPVTCRRRRPRGAPGRRRARCGRSPAPARPRRRPASARSGSRSSRVTIAPTWALSARPLPVTAALTSLGVCSATGMPRRAAATIATPLTWAVPMTVRTLCWLKTRSTATASGRVPVEPRLDAGVDEPQPLGDRQVGGRCARRRPRPASAAGRPSPRPRRGRTGSARGRSPARASGRLSVRTGVRTPTLTERDVPSRRRTRRDARAQASRASSTSSGMSKLPKTFCTSSRSSSASTSRITLAAPSASTVTSIDGTNCASAES